MEFKCKECEQVFDDEIEFITHQHIVDGNSENGYVIVHDEKKEEEQHG